MTRISAAENLSIEIAPAYWRLYLNGDMQERMLAEATQGRALRYANNFAQKRRLPEGTLAPNLIKQVVLGWSNSDQAWHLGLLLMPQLAEQRGSRWCEIARWYDPEAVVYGAAAEQAGRALAQVLDQPFRLIPPAILRDEPAQIRELPALPLKCGIWKFERQDDLLQFVRSPRWMISRVIRVLWYTLWAVVYIVLSVATLTTKLALPNSGSMLPSPRILPYLGLAAAVVLFLIVIKNLFDILTQPGKIVVNPKDHTITAYRGSPRWQMNADEIRSVYVSQVVGQRGMKRTVHHGEINLQVSDNKFRNVIVQEQEEERIEKTLKEKPPHDLVSQITANEVDTDLQAAAIYVAEALGGLPCWYDQRVQ